MNEYDEWTLKNLPPKITEEVLNFLKSGIFYLGGRDNRYRPILLFNPYKLDPKKIPFEICV